MIGQKQRDPLFSASCSGAVRLVVAAMIAFACSTAQALTFAVNNSTDAHDANPGDGVCEVAPSSSVCTLRAALEEANAYPGADAIVLQANTTYLMTLTMSSGGSDAADLVIEDVVSISGAGPDSTIIDGNGTGVHVLAQIPYGPDASSISGVTIRNGILSGAGGASLEGGGIFNPYHATLTLDNVAVTNNSAVLGGGIANIGVLTMTRCLVADNTIGAQAGGAGGGVYNDGSLTIADSTISGNSMKAPGNGGGLSLLEGNATIRNTTITGNSAALGGGAYISDSLVVLINDTISENSSDGNGGGLYEELGATSLYNVTVTGNVANADKSGFDVGGGLATGSIATLNVVNSIIAGNARIIPTLPFPTLDNDECAGTITSQGHNIFEWVNAAHCTLNGPYSSDDPQLGPLQFNGGLTATHAIAPPSPAVDGGDPAGCTDNLGAPVTTDQRGIARPYGPHCDIGAFEYADEIFDNGFNS